jgi:hypothetical protein
MQLNLKLDIKKLALKLVINVGSSLNNLDIEAKNVEVAINLEDLELRIAIFKIKAFLCLNLKLNIDKLALKLVINVGSSLNNLEIETETLKLRLIWKT